MNEPAIPPSTASASADPDCIFCKIARDEIPAKVAYADEHVFAFHDIHPQAPVHIVLIPRVHIRDVADARREHREELGRLLLAAAAVARDLGIEDSGYRLVINRGPNAGQSVDHLHVHILGGRGMGWPPWPE
jgi:histidine triad (HIT) family protein